MSLKFTNFLNSTKSISSIEPKDEVSFYLLLDKSQGIEYKAFENNFAYILQSCRPFFKKYKYYKNTVVYFTFRDIGGHSRLIITNSVGTKRKEAIIKLAKLAFEFDIYTLVKNVSETDRKYFEGNGFHISKNYWSKFSKYDDNTFPQYCIGRESIYNLSSINRDYRRLIKKIESERKITTVRLKKTDEPDALKMLEDNALFLSEKGIDDVSEIIAAHKFFFVKDLRKKILLKHLEGNQVVAYSFLTPVEKNKCAFYNAIFNIKESNLMKYIIYSGIKFVFDNYKEINEVSVQGSENAGQDFMKNRFNPSTAIIKYHLCNDTI